MNITLYNNGDATSHNQIECRIYLGVGKLDVFSFILAFCSLHSNVTHARRMYILVLPDPVGNTPTGTIRSAAFR